MFDRGHVRWHGVDQAFVPGHVLLKGGGAPLVVEVGDPTAPGGRDLDGFHGGEPLPLQHVDVWKVPVVIIQLHWAADVPHQSHLLGQLLELRLRVRVAAKIKEIPPLCAGHNHVNVLPGLQQAVGHLLVQPQFRQNPHHPAHDPARALPQDLGCQSAKGGQLCPGLHAWLVAAPVHWCGWLVPHSPQHLTYWDGPTTASRS